MVSIHNQHSCLATPSPSQRTDLLGHSDVVLLQYIELCSEGLKLLLQLGHLGLQLLQQSQGVTQVVQRVRRLTQSTDGQTDGQTNEQ